LGTALAQSFEILTPGGPNLWWVAQSQNTIAWTCNVDPLIQLTSSLNNTNPNILTAAEAIVANVPNADCSFSVTVQQAALTPATGYTVIFANPINQLEIYAVSQPFEVKALGAAYPPASATPTGGSSSTSSSPSGSSTGSSSSSTSSS
ncbi:hypothetical protein EI94DRAFT_1479907, partial [Lactarius quietus]